MTFSHLFSKTFCHAAAANFRLTLLVLLLFLPSVLAGCGDDPPAAPTAAQTQASAVQTPATAPSDAAAPTATPTANSTAPAAAAGAPKVLALIDGAAILQQDFDNQVTLRAQSGALGDPTAKGEDAEKAALESNLEILENLVTRQVAINEAVKTGFAPTETEIDEAIERIIGSSGGQQEFEMSLKAFGLSMEDLRRQVREGMTVSNWRDLAFLSEAKVSEEEAKEFYDAHPDIAKHEDQVRALQIMIPVPMGTGQNDDQAKAKAKTKAEEILKQATEGADFEQLIELNMDQPTRTAIDNGKLGWVTRGSTGFAELEDVLFKLKPNEVGGLVESPFSFHIVKVLETRPAGVFTFEQLRPEIVEYLTDGKIDFAVRNKVTSLRKAAEVKINDPVLDKAWPDFQAKIASELAPPAGASPASEGAASSSQPAPDVSGTAAAPETVQPEAGASPTATEPAVNSPELTEAQ
ncbi:MAG: peptidylprolyl isomerase [Deltaproteobacteria bacterium]|jgi:parvulin-like peptidyl-prolyl isomerase|nr:peptidylprolyl isomerase [Deltaproteobacteria bacterium]